MFRGYNKPRKSDIFGPSAIGGTSVDSRERQLYQSGEGFGSFIFSLFKKVVPTVGKAIKSISQSSIAKNVGKQLTDSAITGLTNVAADAISGEKSIKESFSDELSNARKEISGAIKRSNKKRKSVFEEEPVKSKKVRKKTSKEVKRRRKIKGSIFNDDYE